MNEPVSYTHLEIRRALEQAGHSRISKLNLFGASDEENERYVQSWQRAISAVCGAVATLQRQKTVSYTHLHSLK